MLSSPKPLPKRLDTGATVNEMARRFNELIEALEHRDAEIKVLRNGLANLRRRPDFTGGGNNDPLRAV